MLYETTIYFLPIQFVLFLRESHGLCAIPAHKQGGGGAQRLACQQMCCALREEEFSIYVIYQF